MQARALRTVAIQSGELVLVLGLVLLFFLLILKFIHFMFPTSSVGLKGLIEAQRAFLSVEPQTHDRKFTVQGAEQSLEGSTAVLLKMRNAVNTKPADAIAWEAASNGMHLFNRDAVQTHDRSTAEVVFHNNDLLRISENSLVIIHQTSGNPFLNEKRSILALIDGELWGRVTSTHVRLGDTPEYEINLRGGGVAKFREDPNSKEGAEFRMKVDSESRATTVMMYKGVAEVTKSGQTVKVTANNATRIEKDEAPTQPKPLPDSPTIEGPKDSKRFLFSTVPPEVVFKWSRVPGATRYRISIARDPEFRDIVEETLVSTTSYQNFELAAGTYFWRVYSVEHDTIGVPSKTRRLTVIKDDEPPKLIVNFPPKIVNKSRYTISGVTDPGATVYVDGVKTKVNGSGRFSYDLELRPGINILVIESIDNVGNTSYKSERIFYKNG